MKTAARVQFPDAGPWNGYLAGGGHDVTVTLGPVAEAMIRERVDSHRYAHDAAAINEELRPGDERDRFEHQRVDGRRGRCRRERRDGGLNGRDFEPLTRVADDASQDALPMRDDVTSPESRCGTGAPRPEDDSAEHRQDVG